METDEMILIEGDADFSSDIQSYGLGEEPNDYLDLDDNEFIHFDKFAKAIHPIHQPMAA